jgi:hypothetical protein
MPKKKSIGKSLKKTFKTKNVTKGLKVASVGLDAGAKLALLTGNPELAVGLEGASIGAKAGAKISKSQEKVKKPKIKTAVVAKPVRPVVGRRPIASRPVHRRPIGRAKPRIPVAVAVPVSRVK